MYRIAFETLSRNYPAFLIVAAILASVDLLGFSTTGSLIFANGLLALWSHRMVLLGDDYGWKGSLSKRKPENIRIGRFLFLYLVMFLVYLLFVGLIAWFWISVGSIPVEDSDLFFTSLLISAVIALVPYGMALALFGTVLPAAATGTKLSFKEAFHLGRPMALVTFGRLFSGSFLFCTCALGIVFLLLAQLPLSDDPYDPISLGAQLVTCFVGLLPIHFAAVALSMAYREAQSPVQFA